MCATPVLWRRLAEQPEFRMSSQGEDEQLAQYHSSTPEAELHEWRTILAERFRLRRNWLRGRCSVRTFTGHTQGISCIQLNNSRIVSGSSDSTIKVQPTIERERPKRREGESEREREREREREKQREKE